MYISFEFFIRITLFILALVGFYIARYIYTQKRKNKPIVCIAGFDCDTVTRSRYSKIFGVPLEVFGMLFYGVFSFAYLFISFMPEYNLPDIIILLLILAPLFSFIFSLYLLYVQLFIIKTKCSLCFLSSFISILIFFLSILIYDFFAAWQGVFAAW